MSKTGQITVTADGPYVVSGAVPLIEQTIVSNADGAATEWQQTGDFPPQEKYALCRCGQSGSKPFCDGSHARQGFDGTETASRKPYADQATAHEGPAYTLLDAEKLCAASRFCDTFRTAWEEVQLSDDPAHAAIVIAQASNCVSGRLVVVDNDTGAPVEHPRPQRISATQDPAEGCSGPLFVEGGIEIVAVDGEPYEPRNRVALCRCGRSGNKPFCDGTHIEIGFSDS